MSELCKAFCADETGATGIEYGLIGSIVSIAIVAALQQMGPSLIEMFESVSAGFAN